MRDFEEKQMERWDNTSGYNYNDRGLALSAAFPALMRKVYTWMTLALAITAITAYGVASSPALLDLPGYRRHIRRNGRLWLLHEERPYVVGPSVAHGPDWPDYRRHRELVPA